MTEPSKMVGQETFNTTGDQRVRRFTATVPGAMVKAVGSVALIGALAVVGYFIVGRKARPRISLLGYVTPLYAVCSVILLMFVLVSRDALAPYSASVWGNLAALAVVPTIIGHTLFNWAIKHVKPAAISVTFLGEPVVAGLLALIFFGQRPAVATFVGGALVLAGVYLTTSK